MLLGIRLAKMTYEELLAYGFTQEEIEAGAHLMSVSGGVSNSTQILTDLTTATTTALTAGELASGIAAAGPIQDLAAMIQSVLRNAQEMTEKLNYLLGGTALTPASLTAPSGGPIVTGDNGVYNLLVGVFQILK